MPRSAGSAAVAAAALLEGADGTQKIDLAESGPEDVGEIKFAVSALPQQKPREADLPARPYDQIGIGQPGGAKMGGDRLGGDLLDRLGQSCLPARHAAQQGTHRVGYLLTPAIG